MNLLQKLQQLREKAGSNIPKNGIAPSSAGGFRYYLLEDILSVVKPLLVELHLSIHLSNTELSSSHFHEKVQGKYGEKLEFFLISTAKLTFEVHDLEKEKGGDVLQFVSSASSASKNTGFSSGSAITYATRYFYQSLLMLTDSDEPETTELPPQSGSSGGGKTRSLSW